MDTDLFDRLLEERIRHSAYTPARADNQPDGRYSRRWQVNW